jgi:deaminated glutathione amidase
MIHMFDVDLGKEHKFKESDKYNPGNKATILNIGKIKIGITICYDLRFPNLYRTLANNGCNLFIVPSSFTKITGQAHWHTLLKARAIENGCFVIAPAQGGIHADGRETFGHSLIINPWGEITGEKEEGVGFILADINLDEVENARNKIPSLKNGKDFSIHEFIYNS